MDRDMIDRIASDLALPSRQQALAVCRGALAEGPVLLTGEPGVGKTWMVRRLAVATPDTWVGVDAFPGMTADDFRSAVGAGLGLSRTPSRIRLARALREAAADGRPATLALDEAHLASSDLLEEVRILSNRLGQPDGFAAILIVGQTPLRVRLESRAMQGLRSRIAAQVHLLPLDADEAEALLARVGPGRVDGEVLHREAAGNPRRLLMLAGRAGVNRVAASSSPVSLTSPPAETPLTMSQPMRREPTPVPAPTKPPLRVEDGLIEVGYESDQELELDEPEVGPRPPATLSEAGETPIDDHYAALQAWDEWVRNQSQAGLMDDFEPDDVVLDPGAQTWADPGQPFAPYSQLFSRLKSSAEASINE